MPSKKPHHHQLTHEKQAFVVSYCSNISWFLILICFIFGLFFVSVTPSLYNRDDRSITTLGVLRIERNSPPANVTVTKNVENSDKKPADSSSETDQYAGKSEECAGKYIYVQELPSRFNDDLLRNCSTLNPWTDACKLLANSGLGLKLNITDDSVFSGSNWYATDQWSVEIIFRSRMKQYRCLTNKYSEASAVFVPYYAGLDVGRYLWVSNTTLRDTDSLKLVEFLRKKPEWKKYGGRDHFLIAGRMTYDFIRISENSSSYNGWGNRLLLLPEVKNMTTLLLEATPKSKSEVAIPYPTSFHPSSGNEIRDWQASMKQKNRPYLFSFAGAPRPNDPQSVRNVIIDQCLAAKNNHCKYVHTNPDVTPETIMRLFQSSDFCVQPPGDSYTRKSIFDTILAGCIPVLLHPGSAYVQYKWHLPRNYSSYSVFIPIDELKQGNVSIEKRLLEIPKKDVISMREEVIKLIPSIVYANPESKTVSFEDAFDVALKGVLDRVETLKMQIEGGKFATSEIIPNDLENHDWDKYF